MHVLVTIEVYNVELRPPPAKKGKMICTVSVEAETIKEAHDQLTLLTAAINKAGLHFE
jgi:hypothetical protein